MSNLVNDQCGTFNMGSRAAWIAAFCVLAFSTHIAEAYVHTQVSSMSKDCQTRYADLIASIPAPADPEDEASCHDVIVNATDNTSGVDCPASDTLVACFQVIMACSAHTHTDTRLKSVYHVADTAMLSTDAYNACR